MRYNEPDIFPGALSMIRRIGVLLTLLSCGGLAFAGSQDSGKVSFHRQIKPILQKRCQGCHQPATQGGKLVLTTFETFRAGAASGPGFKPSDPDSSVGMR